MQYMATRDKITRDYEVTVFVGGMQYPEIGTLTIEAPNKQLAIKWVTENIGFTAKRI